MRNRPAGIQSALTLAQRGYRVKLFDKRTELCGSLNLANKAPNKFRMDNLIALYKRQIAKTPSIEVHLNTEVTPGLLDQLAEDKPHAVILASGGKPIVPGRIPGVEKGIACFDVLNGMPYLFACIGGAARAVHTQNKSLHVFVLADFLEHLHHVFAYDAVARLIGYLRLRTSFRRN